jgi:hypothetical protein
MNLEVQTIQGLWAAARDSEGAHKYLKDKLICVRRGASKAQVLPFCIIIDSPVHAAESTSSALRHFSCTNYSLLVPSGGWPGQDDA